MDRLVKYDENLKCFGYDSYADSCAAIYKLYAYEETGLSPQEIMDAIKVTLAEDNEMLTITDDGWSVTAPAWWLRRIMKNWIDPERDRIKYGDWWMGVDNGSYLCDDDGKEIGVFRVDETAKTATVEMYELEENAT